MIHLFVFPLNLRLHRITSYNVCYTKLLRIFGIPLPVCSCSVIPIAQGLKKEGASKGAVQSFLISTPITGVDSILATFSFFGLVFTIFRIISSVIIAIIVGLIQNFVENKNSEEVIRITSYNVCYTKLLRKNCNTFH